MNGLARPMPQPTAQVETYVEVLGADLAMDFLLKFGGAELYLPTDPKGKSEVEKLLGYEKRKALAARPRLQRHVPLAKRWLAKMLHRKGYTNANIARTLRVSTLSVKRYLRDEYGATRQEGGRKLPAQTSRQSILSPPLVAESGATLIEGNQKKVGCHQIFPKLAADCQTF